MKKIVCSILILFVGTIIAFPDHFTNAAQGPTPEVTGNPPLQVEESWPKEIKSGEQVFTIHQPQLESWDGSRIEAYSAIEVRIPGSENPIYGAVLITAKTDVDKTERMVEFKDIQIPRAVFPSAGNKTEPYLKILRDNVIEKARFLSLDRFEAALAVMKAGQKIDALPLKSDPPRIIFSSVPAILIYLDGPAVLKPVKDTPLQRVINTRPLLLRDSAGRHYLHLFDGWMEAGDLSGPWAVSDNPPGDLEKAKKDAIDGGQVDLLEGVTDPESEEEKPSLKKGQVPIIYTATEPTELIVTEGEPEYEAIDGTSLLYAKNTTGHLFTHSMEKKTYVLISGRWFRSASLKGPWIYVPGGKLPSDFAEIPDSSPKENVKASVPDTPQSMEAVIANSIPQMATVDRKNTKLNPPQFDGKPEFEAVAETGLQHAVNTGTPIIKTGPESFYAVENGVWFSAQKIEGPWSVADSVPASIYTIPPSSPMHYVTYVKIYGATADTVNVGYTQGYYGAYVTRGSGFVVVYGTGYHYTPWVGSVWFGPPVTYGLGSSITYTPWTGWTYSYGFGWYWGTAMVPMGWGWGPYPWWGPVGWGIYYPYPYYRPVYGGAVWGPRGGAAWGIGGWAATTGNIYHRWGASSAVTRASRGYNAFTGNKWANQVGLSYNSRTGNIAAGQRAAVGNVYTGEYAYGRRGTVTNTRTGNSVSGGRVTVGDADTGQRGSAGWVSGERGSAVRVGDDIYAGKDGSVYRKGESGWQKNAGSGWNSVDHATPVARQNTDVQVKRRDYSSSQTSNRSTIQSMERQSSARYRGNMRTQSFRNGGYRGAGGGSFRRRR